MNEDGIIKLETLVEGCSILLPSRDIWVCTNWEDPGLIHYVEKEFSKFGGAQIELN